MTNRNSSCILILASRVTRQQNMHEWLSGGVSPCQGEGRGFESRLVLLQTGKRIAFRFFYAPTGLPKRTAVCCFRRCFRLSRPASFSAGSMHPAGIFLLTSSRARAWRRSCRRCSSALRKVPSDGTDNPLRRRTVRRGSRRSTARGLHCPLPSAPVRFR